MADSTDIQPIVYNALWQTLPEDTPAEDLDRAARAVIDALRGLWVRPAYQARVQKGVKLNMREEPTTQSRIDGQLFENAVVSVINPEPEGPDEFVSVVYAAFASRKSLEKINNG